jgi:hypothetical protein
MFLIGTLLGCGGAVERSSSGEDDANSEGEDEPERDAAPPLPPGDTPLGACRLGTKLSEVGSENCAWVAEQRCYQDREMACNCACPRSRDSLCSSGFAQGPQGRVWVSCQ